MASSEHLKALIKSHISRDDGHFYSVAMQMAAHEVNREIEYFNLDAVISVG